jgi:hypothetical protein
MFESPQFLLSRPLFDRAMHDVFVHYSTRAAAAADEQSMVDEHTLACLMQCMLANTPESHTPIAPMQGSLTADGFILAQRSLCAKQPSLLPWLGRTLSNLLSELVL